MQGAAMALTVWPLNRRVSQMRALLAACPQLPVDYKTLPEVLYVVEHKA